jgi:hypothetical protein
MKDFRARFHAPVEMARPRGARLIEGYSAKLQRRVRLFGFGHSSFAQWIRLEADPAVLAFCERPARVGPERDARPVDFWVHALGGEAMLLLESQRCERAPSQLGDIAVRTVGAAELAAASIWISNWSCMLPVINTTRTLVPTALLRSVLDHVCGPVPLGRLEHDLAGRPVLGAWSDLRAPSQGQDQGAFAAHAADQPSHRAGAGIVSRRQRMRDVDPAAWPIFDMERYLSPSGRSLPLADKPSSCMQQGKHWSRSSGEPESTAASSTVCSIAAWPRTKTGARLAGGQSPRTHTFTATSVALA